MNYGELKRLLRKSKCRFDHDGGRHEMWYSPITDTYFPVPRHDGHEVPQGTLKSILRDAGIKQ
ncbi:MAG: type II toxin-antitoxin system HicA family toxin [Clostridia bacterium]|nr:type II toxin-antitoxin system HicA family toxin [Clostridia bacterium]